MPDKKPARARRDDLLGEPDEGFWERAPRVKVPRWWLKELQDATSAWKVDEEEGLIQLANDLSKFMGRADPWTHGTVSKHLRGKMFTMDMVEALTLFFGLPDPIYYPTSFVEADRLTKRSIRGPEYEARRAELDAAAEKLLSQSGDRQPGAVRSSHEQHATRTTEPVHSRRR